MPFLTIKGVEVYMHLEPPKKLYKAAVSTRNVVRRRIARLLLIPYVLLGVYVFALLAFKFDILGDNWGYYGLPAVTCLIISQSLKREYLRIEATQVSITRGKEREFFVVPKDFSYQVVFTDLMRTAMVNDRTKKAVDSLLGNKVVITCDEEIRTGEEYEWDYDPDTIKIDFSSKTTIIDMVQRLCEGLGLSRQVIELGEIRESEIRLLHERVTTSLRRAEEDIVELKQMQVSLR